MRRLITRFLTWSDPEKAISRTYRGKLGLPLDGEDVTAVLLDANQRVLEVQQGADAGQRMGNII